MDLRKILLEHWICGSFFLWHLTSSSQLVIKKSSYIKFSHSKWGQCFSEKFIILNKKHVIWWHFDDNLRVRGQESEKKKQQIPHLGFFFRFKKKTLIIILQFFKGFFLSGSIKTFNSFEDFFFNVQFWMFVSEIWLEEFFKDAKQIFNYIDLENWYSKKIS
jgi:hypothetical protein